MTQHKYAEILRAIADGKKIQVLHDGKWQDKRNLTDAVYLWPDNTYRVKPDTQKYRVYEYTGPATGKNFIGVTTNDDEAGWAEAMDGFNRWLGDWVEYEVCGLDWRKIAHEV